ncbi:GNAT family N-acetyltransferase [Candidatus Bathyarchaeota archaeon]|nr:GNAT family N-acetyltransferase [Candidatus Bathyarchaeota archaeon]
MQLRKVSVRAYSTSDFPQVKKLILDAENFGEPFLSAEILNIKKNTTLGLGAVFVAVFNNQIIGYVSLGQRIFALMVDSIIVDRSYQRKGVGKKLISKAKEYARCHGFEVLRTDTGTFMDYAIKFYLTCGFEPCGYVEHDFSRGSKQLHFFIDLVKKTET